jgi:acyl-CoA synthetase (AMP-forming)/AMP-acid ligase II
MPVAAVVRESGATISADALVAWAKEHMAPYKAPRRVVFVDAIPQNFAMKAKRREVRKQVMEMLEERQQTTDDRRQTEGETTDARRQTTDRKQSTAV